MLRTLIVTGLLWQAASAVGADVPKVANRWAVLIGVDDYAYAQKLQYCGADQRALRDRLVKSGFPDDQVFLLEDKAADVRQHPSQRNIERHLDLVINLAEEDDLIVVAFSGHGVHLDGKSFLCPNDCSLDKADTLIALDGIYDRLKQCSATFKLVIVDACRNDPRPGGTRSMTANEGTRALARSLQDLKLPEGVVLLNSCAPGEVSWEDEQFGHGVFMHYVLGAIDGAGDADGDGHVSLFELQLYAAQRTKAYVANQHRVTQRPFFKGDVSVEALQYALLPVRRDAATPPPAPPTNSTVNNSTDSTPRTTPPPTNGAGQTYVPTQRAVFDPTEAFTNGVGMKLVLIPAGDFRMGSLDGTRGIQEDETPAHVVTLTRPFYLSTHEVTQGVWKAVMGTTPWSGRSNRVQLGDDFPAVFISWHDAVEFCRKLGAKENRTYRLPTEAEWEFACRAGTSTIYHFGNDESRISEYAWWGGIDGRGNAADGKYAHAVGTRQPNAWGLFDMAGNVQEWCQDYYGKYDPPAAALTNPQGPNAGSSRVVRGGSWDFVATYCRSAHRSGMLVEERTPALGFRVAADR